MRARNNLWLCAVLAALTLPSVAVAAVPTTLAVEGVMTSTGGGPVADGQYPVTYQLLDSPTGTAVWSEGPSNVTVKSGQFSATLGAKTPLNPAIVAGERWLQVQVATDAPLPAVPLRAMAYALRAAVAEGLECTGCIKAGQLDASVLQAYAKSSDLTGLAKTADLAAYAKTSDLGAYAKTADLGEYVKAAALAKVAATGNYADLAGAPKLADVATTGNYGDLKGTPVLAKLGTSCGTGLVMKGLKADGSYECVAGFDPAALPKDALDEVSNGLLTNQFNEIAASTKAPFDIADNLPAGVSDAIDVPDFGIAQGVKVAVKLTNSDLSKVRITVYDPSGTAYKLFDQSGTGTALDGVWPAPNKLVSGDLGTWIGKNPKGMWSINVADLAGTGGAPDGKVLAWSMQVQTLSSKKVAATGGFQLAVTDAAPTPCGTSTFGMMYASQTDQAVYVCNGKSWYPINITAIGTKEAPAVSCKDLLTKAPLTKSGVYWIDPDGLGGNAAFDAYCEMNLAGGGWTLLFNLESTDGVMHAYDDTAFWTGTKTEGASDKALSAGYKGGAFAGLSGATEAMVLAHDNGTTKGYAVYDLVPGAKDKTMQSILASSNDFTWTAPRKQASGTVGATLNTKRSQTEFGDPFIDHGEAIVLNKQSGWSAQQNKNRLSTTLTNSQYSHTLGGLGGSHINSGWGDQYESAPIASYCDCMNLYGNASNHATNGQANSITVSNCYDSGGAFKWLPIDTAVWVR